MAEDRGGTGKPISALSHIVISNDVISRDGLCSIIASTKLPNPPRRPLHSPLAMDSVPPEIILEILSNLDIPSFLAIRLWYPPSRLRCILSKPLTEPKQVPADFTPSRLPTTAPSSLVYDARTATHRGFHPTPSQGQTRSSFFTLRATRPTPALQSTLSALQSTLSALS